MSNARNFNSAPGAAPTPGPATALQALITRLHFYVGLFVGPFILVAAVSGTLFVLTPQIENRIYADVLYSDATGPAHSLTEQIAVARTAVGPDPRLFAVRPAPGPGTATRVMFSQPGLGDAHRAIFIDPVTLAARGDLPVYGTSGDLPLRTTLDTMHRNLLLGDLGRNYSELAASWLWFAGLGGIVLWACGRRRHAATATPPNARARLRRAHSIIGLSIAIGLFFLSATGLTWSRWAGGHIDMLRSQLGWVTPSVSTSLKPQAPAVPRLSGQHTDHMQAMREGGEHAGHTGHAMGSVAPTAAARSAADLYASRFDEVFRTARQAGIDAADVEIRVPRQPDQAWLVREVDRSWPTQVDTVAIDGRNMTVVSRADFATFPLVAKLIRWGIDTHMGILFGWLNQLLMAAFGIALSSMVVLGYAMWWRRRPPPGSPVLTVTQAWTRLGAVQRGVALLVAAALGWALPVMGISLLAFLAADVLRWQLTRNGIARRNRPATS